MIASPLAISSLTWERLNPTSNIWNAVSSTPTDSYTMQISSQTTGKPGQRTRRALIKLVRSQPSLAADGTMEDFTLNFTIVQKAENSAFTDAEKETLVEELGQLIGSLNYDDFLERLFKGES